MQQLESWLQSNNLSPETLIVGAAMVAAACVLVVIRRFSDLRACGCEGRMASSDHVAVGLVGR